MPSLPARRIVAGHAPVSSCRSPLSLSETCAICITCPTYSCLGLQVYPTGVRSFFHGMSAAAGKVGALVAAVAFEQASAAARGCVALLCHV